MEFKKIKSGFTLVELIIVITVLAILATIAFVSFQSYTANARDSVRAVNLKDLSKAIELHKISTGKFPKPGDVYATGQLLGTNLFTVGKINSDLSKLLKFSKIPVDPVSGSEYLYGLNYNNKYFEVAGTFESQQTSFFVGKAHADIGKYFSRIEGNYKGLMLFSTGSQQYIANVPSLIFSREGTYELIGNEVYFITHNGKNFAYSVDGQTTIQNQTVEEVLAQKTGKNVQVDYLDIQDWEDDSEQFVDRLGYQKDLIGFEIFGKSYEPTGESGGEDEEEIPDTPTSYEYKYLLSKESYNCGITLDGKVACWGYIPGIKTEAKNRPLVFAKELIGIQNAKKVVGRSWGVCILFEDGSVKCDTENYYGDLGNGTKGTENASQDFVDVIGLSSNVTDIIMGDSGYACALLNNGSVRCWGNGMAIGDGTGEDNGTPVEIFASGVTEIKAGYDYACAKLSNNTLSCWGSNDTGQLGDGTTDNSYVPKNVPGLTNISEFTLGGGHVCVIDGGNLKCWGLNDYGQLGDGTMNNVLTPKLITSVMNPLMLYSGRYTTCVRTSTNIKCAGHNTSSQLGIGYSSVGEVEFKNIIFDTSNIIDLSTGVLQSCGLFNDNSIQCWGMDKSNSFYGGEIETWGSNTPVKISEVGNAIYREKLFRDVVVGKKHTCGITLNDTVKCWGANDKGQLGNGLNVNSNKPVEVLGLQEVASISLGADFSCAVTYNGEGKCWGANDKGQLGNGLNTDSNIPVTISNIEIEGSISSGADFSCAVTYNGEGKCWGANDNGQLGNGLNVNSNIPVTIEYGEDQIIQILSGDDFACYKTDSGVKCWGANDKGQLGKGDYMNTNTPTSITGITFSGEFNLFLGYSASCVVIDQEIKCWGDNSKYQLGKNGIPNSPNPIIMDVSNEVSVFVFSGDTAILFGIWEGEYWGNNANYQYGSINNTVNNVPTKMSGNINLLSIGGTSSCGIQYSQIICRGDNTYGQLGDGTNTSSSIPVFVKTE